MSLEEDVLDNNAKETEAIKDYAYPLNFQFKITSLANDFNVKDANGNSLAYVRQKMFKLKEAISVFSNESKSELLYKINADRIIDFNASYSFTNADEEVIGRVGRKGAKSLLKAHYEIFNNDNKQEFVINEENPWAKVGDAVLGEIPVVGMFTGYFCNPRYAIKRADGTIVARLSKEASFMGRKFKLEKLSELNEGEGERMVLAIMMMSLLERRRG
jgi:uncharacterized protein YxjI